MSDARAARHLTLLAASTAASAPLLMLLFHWLRDDAAAVAVLGAGAAMAGAPLLLRAGRSLELATNVFLSALFALTVWLAVQLGGLAAATTAWLVLCPLVAALVNGTRAALVWSALVFKAYAVLFLWDRYVSAFVAYPVADPQLLALAGQLGLLGPVLAVTLCWCSRATDQPPAGA